MSILFPPPNLLYLSPQPCLTPTDPSKLESHVISSENLRELLLLLAAQSQLVKLRFFTKVKETRRKKKKQGEAFSVPLYLLTVRLESSFAKIFLEAQTAHVAVFSSIILEKFSPSSIRELV